MNIYQSYVFADKLISPANGYSCRRITKQNIKQFGFESIEQLLVQYPEFPLICCEYHTSVKLASKKGSAIFQQNSKIKSLKKYNTQLYEYSLNPINCEYCDTVLPYAKRHNTYCSTACANSGTKKSKNYIPTTFCNYCKEPLLFHKRKQKFCSMRCAGNMQIKTHTKTKPKTAQVRITANPYKNHPPVKVECHCCKKDFEVNAAYFHKRKIKLFYCEDDVCMKTVMASISEHTGKRSANKRCLRSKQEIQLFELCNKLYKVTSNEIIADGWDADIVFPEHKVAVLWNGPWHYKEMGHSNHSLNQVVTRDCIKIQLFENLGWKVLIYQDNIWTPETAFVDIILQIGFNNR